MLISTQSNRYSGARQQASFKALLGVLLVLGSPALPAMSITALGDLPGGEFLSRAYGISADGSTVVGSSNNDSSHGEAFRWTASGGMVGLGDLADGRFGSHAQGISADGSTVVGIVYNAQPYGEAFRWTTGDGMVSLGDLAGGIHASEAHGTSADGLVVTGLANSSYSQPFRWTSGGGMTGLGDLPGEAAGSFSTGSGNGISADGATVVGYSTSASGEEAFRWTAGDGMVGLGDLPGGDFGSNAYGISADGSSVVGSASSASGEEAFRWTAAGGMVGLGHVGDGATRSKASAISADGSTVVGYDRISAEDVAFRWTAGDGMVSLWDILLTGGVDPALDGWSELNQASAVSGTGRYVAGWGIHNGETEAFLVDLGSANNGGGGEPTQGRLEIPSDASYQAGVGIVSGWHCRGSDIEVSFDRGARIKLGSGTTRSDTATICGDVNNGFSLLWAYTLLGEGQHIAVVYADGVEFDRAIFTVTLIDGEQFLQGASGTYALPNFPDPGKTVVVKWSEASQSFIVTESD